MCTGINKTNDIHTCISVMNYICTNMYETSGCVVVHNAHKYSNVIESGLVLDGDTGVVELKSSELRTIDYHTRTTSTGLY